MITMPSATVWCARAIRDTGPASEANRAMHRAMGTKARPALVGEKPRMVCR